MGAWQILAGLGLLFLILEMTVPTMFFLNFAVGAFVTAICSIYIFSWTALTIIFVAVSLVSLFCVHYWLKKQTNHKRPVSAQNISEKSQK